MKPLGLAQKLPLKNLVVSDNFEFSALNTKFDYGIAVSVFTHLPFNHIRLCLENISDVLEVGGSYFATIFECPDSTLSRNSIQQSHKFSHAIQDPYHYSIDDMDASNYPLK